MFKEQLLKLLQQRLLRKPMIIESYAGPYVTINSRRMLLMCSNDYLGLAQHPALQEAAVSAVEQFGFGSGASRLVSGTSSLHRELEERICNFKKTESAILCNSGYGANTGTIPAIAEEGDAIFSDSLNHASIIDGCRLSKAAVHVYRHKDVDHLEVLLKKNGHARRKLIVTDSVFSMDGDIAPLPELVELSDRYNALLMIDDAHATGVLGMTGRGSVEHFNLEGRVPIQMGTLGKAFGSCGAYVAGSKDLIDLLINRSRSYIYSTALPPAICAASLAAIRIVEQEPERRISLWRNRELLVSGLTSMGINVGNSETPIVPVIIGDQESTLKAAAALFGAGIYTSAIRPPTVPEGTSRLRLTLMATHTDRHINTALSALKLLKNEGLIP